MKLLISILFCCISIIQPIQSNDVLRQLDISEPISLKGLSSNEIQQIFMDKDGLMWLATRYGLYSYDGYSLQAYKNTLDEPEQLTHNTVLCIGEDNYRKLYVGTERGLTILNKVNSELQRKIIPNIANQIISCLLVTKDNKVWLGTDSGLCLYDQKLDSFYVYGHSRTGNILPTTAIKSLIEDSDGDIWIGTWDKGLYRYARSENRFYAYPRFNERNSAHTIFEDQEKNIWIGTWGCGLYRLRNAKDMENLQWTNYRSNSKDVTSLSNDIVYSISEHKRTRSIWIGTCSGLSIMPYETQNSTNKNNSSGEFINYCSNHSDYYMASNEVTNILPVNHDFMWLATYGGGVFQVNVRLPFFQSYSPETLNYSVTSNWVRNLLVDKQGNVWINGGGLLRCDQKGKNAVIYKDLPEFKHLNISDVDISVQTTIQRKAKDEIWFGLIYGKILIYTPGKPVKILEPMEHKFISSYRLSVLMEDSKGNCWAGTREGVGVMYADGGEVHLDHIYIDQKPLNTIWITTLAEDYEGSIWLGTKENGIIRLQGNIKYPESLKVTSFNAANRKFCNMKVLCIHQDKSGRLWAGTEGGGLFLYDAATDSFCSVNQAYKLSADIISNIEVDDFGCIWLGTNEGIIKLAFLGEKTPIVRVYTEQDGISNYYFAAGMSSQKDGRIFLAGRYGFTTFVPTQIEENSIGSPVILSDVLLGNTSFLALSKDERQAISKQIPTYADEIAIPNEYNNFTLKFSILTYELPQLCHYAYKLEGFDEDWNYTDGTNRAAYYTNLKPGTYTFHLKASNANGIWSTNVRNIHITVLPPWYTSMWAWIVYILLFIVAVYVAYQIVRHRVRLENQLRMSSLEQTKSEELNHAKLQFFTNITHEILTPLTIISATVDELKTNMPLHKEYYTVIGNNVNRLMRLIQQILEFRKAETGNLQLRVSEGDVVQFVKNTVEAFHPLIRKRKLHFSMICDKDSIRGYFDPDKLDKILYNLISNALKYNNEGGFVHIELSLLPDKKTVQLVVTDNGAGISTEEMKTLFSRFYEGNHRRYNTIGTGIGLSLTKDLVTLHGGTIQAKSEPERGTSFVVTLPINKEAFTLDQIDEQKQVQPQQIISGMEDVDNTTDIDTNKSNNIRTLLLVEDEEELLMLMRKLLTSEYHVLTATNGEEAMRLIVENDIDLIITDVMMPVMNGIELCKRVKGNLEFSHIPVIMLTAKTSEESRTIAYEVGADGYITKPFNLSVLHARIKNLLRNKERNATDFKKQVVFELQDMNYTTLDEEFLQRAIECVNHHLSDPDFDQPQMLLEIGTSKSSLYKKLKALTGLNPSAFIRNIRLKAACKMMEEKKNLRVNELAYAVGFNDAKYFSSCFRKEFGILPSDYRAKFTNDSEQISDFVSEEQEMEVKTMEE